MVALLPGSRTRSVSAGSGLAGLSRRSSTRAPPAAGRGRRSWRSAAGAGRRSSRRAPAARGGRSEPHTSSAGRSRGGGEPWARCRACRGQSAQRISGRASVEQARVAAELVDDEAAINARAPRASSTVTVPTIWAMTPPRSMSPTSTTGTPARVGEAHVGDVALAQVHLGRAARALDDDEVRALGEPGEALEDAGHQRGLEAVVVAGAAAGQHPPLHHHLRAGLALGLEQHRVHVDAAARPRRRAPAAPGRGRSRRRRPSPPRCCSCSAA